MTKNKLKKLIFFISVPFVLSNLNAQEDIFDNTSKFTFSDLISDIKSGAKADTREIQVSTITQPSNELVHFWENLKDHTFEDICKAAEIKLNQDTKLENIAGIEGKFERYLRQFPDKRIALIDTVGVKIDASLGKEILNVPDFGPLNVSISGSIEGKSIVVRPLESTKYCKELDTLIDLRKIKTILPINEKRISEMKKGEIWKFPITTRFSFSSGISAPVATYITISIGAGVSKERKPSITLYRIDENNIRLRIRIDRILVKSVNAGISSTFSIDAGDIGLFEAENILTKEINRQIAKEINKYLAAKISYGHSRFSGRKILLEFLINPNDNVQLENLVQLLKGDLGIIKKFIQLGLKFNEFKETDNASQGLNNMNEVINEAENHLGIEANFTGANHYHGHSDNLDINIPIIHNHNTSWSTSYNRYQTMEEKDGVIHVSQSGKTSNGSSINIPFVGTLIKYNSEKNIYVINKESSDNKVSQPVLLFQHNVGFVRQDENVARGIISSINNVLKYVGVHGNGINENNLIPVDDIFPTSPQPESNMNEIDSGNSGKRYRAAVISFKLMFSKEGIQEILMAPAEMILKSYLNVMKEAESFLIRQVGHLFFIDKKGNLDYDRNKAAQILGIDEIMGSQNGSINPLDILRDMAYTATCLIKDIFSIRDEQDWKKQAIKLSAIAAGRSKSKMGFEDFFKVVIQLASKENVSAEVYVHTDKRIKGEEDITQTYNYFNNRDNNFNSTISEVNTMRERFSDPSLLTD